MNEFKYKQFYLKDYNSKKEIPWPEQLKKLSDKWPEQEKYEKKLEELKCKEVKLLLFDKYLKDLK